ncbi:hypothetical protein WICPIJ_002425 [Wickerhamomyces pijperi]|uniref:DNA polymerase delta catalytic subunit n=1 Tax=Wickerhamomyces pijperi TaxID=599730 RepID=A0A9P8TPN3_WICPI|nr:hypothetical protein WICPIJ_002425 [Wickerhamomyces pijperi]
MNYSIDHTHTTSSNIFQRTKRKTSAAEFVSKYNYNAMAERHGITSYNNNRKFVRGSTKYIKKSNTGDNKSGATSVPVPPSDTSSNQSPPSYCVTSDSSRIKCSIRRTDNKQIVSTCNHNSQDILRPPIPKSFNHQTDNLTFKQYIIDPYIDSDNISYLRLHGLTEHGNSVSCKLTGFLHYFYVDCAVSFDDDPEIFNQYIQFLRQRYPGIANVEFCIRDVTSPRVGCERGEEEEEEEQLVYLLKVHVEPHDRADQIRKDMEIKGLYFPVISEQDEEEELGREEHTANGGFREAEWISYEVKTYYNVEYSSRFTMDYKINGPTSWITLPAGQYQLLNQDEKKSSTCQFEVVIDHRFAIYHETSNISSDIRLRTLSLTVLTDPDLDSTARQDEAKCEQVLQISNVIRMNGISNPMMRIVFMIGDCVVIPGDDYADVQFINCGNEIDLLLRWGQFVRDSDCDVIMGDHVWTLHLRYVLQRAERLGIFGKLCLLLGRVKPGNLNVADSESDFELPKDCTKFGGRVLIDISKHLGDEKKVIYGISEEKINYDSVKEANQELSRDKIYTLQRTSAITRGELALKTLVHTEAVSRVLNVNTDPIL